MPRRIKHMREGNRRARPNDLSSSWEKSLLYSLKREVTEKQSNKEK